MPTSLSREEVKNLLSSLLIARKEALTTGVPIVKLDYDFKEETGIRIPFREFGHGCLVDFLRSLPDGLSIRPSNGMHYAYPVVSEKTQHVSNLVAGQNRRKMARPTRRLHKPSAYYPKVQLPPMRLSSKQLTEIAKLVKNNVNGIHHSRVLDFVKKNLDAHINWMDLKRQLADIAHEVEVAGDWLYPAVSPYRHQEYKQPQPRDASTSEESRANSQPSQFNERKATCRPAGFSHSEDDDCSKDFYAEANEKIVQKEDNKPKENHPSNEKTPVYPTSTSDKNETVKCPPGFHELQETTSTNDDATDNEAISHLINERTRIRLQKLIEKHPDGIWCADLPQLYRNEYTIPLNYEELGFVSVIEFVSHLPGIFQSTRPQDKGDFKLYNAKTGIPDAKPRERPKVATLATLHNIYEQYVEPTEAIPSVLSKLTMDKLIPDGVMTANETVAQICVTELNRGINEYINVIVCDVYTPTFFWIQLFRRIPKFQSFMNELHAFYEREAKKYVLPLAVMEKGMNCACTYDGKWHRAIIKTVRPDNYVTVLFYDYGTIKSYPAESIHFLHRKFSNIPAQAIPCGLYNVKPVSGTQWPWNVACEFVNRTTNVPLVATIASIDTDTNSMMVALTNTDGPEDFHINDWMVQSGFAVYGSMGETVDMNERPYNQSSESRSYGTGQGQNGLSSISEKEEPNITDFTLAKSIAMGFDIHQHMNECIRVSAARFKFDVEIFLKNGISAEPDVIKIFEELCELLRPTCSSNDPVSSGNGTSPTPVTPQQSNGPTETSTVQSNVKNHENTFSSRLEPEVADESANPPADVFVELTTPMDPTTTVKFNGFAEHQSDHDSSPNVVSDAPVDQFESYFPERTRVVTESAPTLSNDWVTSMRQKFQDSLRLSVHNFSERTFASKQPSEPGHFQFKDTNPFRLDVLSEMNSQSLPEKSQLKRPRRASSSHTKRPEFEPQPRVIYESGPVMYNNENKNYSNYMEKTKEIMKERQKIIELKRVNVESWIESGFHANNNYSVASTPSTGPPAQTLPDFNETPIERVVCNGTRFSNNNSSRSPSDWLDSIDSAIAFQKRIKSPSDSNKSRFETMREIPDAEQLAESNAVAPKNITSQNQDHSVSERRIRTEIAYAQDATGQMIWSVRKVPLQ
ncbi:tudor domain-containing protein 5-like isoform X3 [Venturia canescens]|uniref:tudor domain-containing protein 5-like isoform X3 n=1 Tax=Venturia canescens TaxID=32260 RepID=UPI001C9C99C2|nr:tudor domain-containing protein 5-like isoform X3 [Venturia canescens]